MNERSTSELRPAPSLSKREKKIYGYKSLNVSVLGSWAAGARRQHCQLQVEGDEGKVGQIAEDRRSFAVSPWDPSTAENRLWHEDEGR